MDYEAYFFWCGVVVNCAGLLLVGVYMFFHLAEGWFEWGSRAELAKRRRESLRSGG